MTTIKRHRYSWWEHVFKLLGVLMRNMKIPLPAISFGAVGCTLLCVLLAGCAATPGRDRPLDPTMAIAFSPDGRTVAVSTPTTDVALFDVVPLRFRVLLTPDEGRTLSWKEAKTRPGVTGLFRSPPVAFTPNGELLVSAGAGGDLVGWSAGLGTVQFRTPAVTGTTDLAFLPDGESFLTVGPTVKCWSTKDGSVLRELKPPGNTTATSVAVAPDGKLILVGLSSGEIAKLDAATLEVLRVMKGHSAPVTGIAFSPDGSAFATTAGRFDPRIWNPAEDSPLPRKPSEVGGVSESLETAARETQALAMFAWILGTAAGFRVVGAPTMGAPPPQYPALERAASESSSYCGPRVAYSPDGRFLAATAQLSLISGEFQLLLVDMARKEGRLIHGIYGCSVAFTRDSKFVVTGGLGAPVFWNVETGARVDGGKAGN